MFESLNKVINGYGLISGFAIIGGAAYCFPSGSPPDDWAEPDTGLGGASSR